MQRSPPARPRPHPEPTAPGSVSISSSRSALSKVCTARLLRSRRSRGRSRVNRCSAGGTPHPAAHALQPIPRALRPAPPSPAPRAPPLGARSVPSGTAIPPTGSPFGPRGADLGGPPRLGLGASLSLVRAAPTLVPFARFECLCHEHPAAGVGHDRRPARPRGSGPACPPPPVALWPEVAPVAQAPDTC